MLARALFLNVREKVKEHSHMDGKLGPLMKVIGKVLSLILLIILYGN